MQINSPLKWRQIFVSMFITAAAATVVACGGDKPQAPNQSADQAQSPKPKQAVMRKSP